MKKLLILLLLTGCKHERPQISEYPDFSWCDVNFQWWGDSFTAAPGAVPAAWYMADYLNKDTLIAAPSGWYMAAGDKVVGNYGYSGATSEFIRDQYLESADRTRAQVIWIGRNNAWDTAQIAKDIDRMLSELPHKHFVIVGILTGDWYTEWKGTQLYDVIHGFNARMALRYGRHFVDPLDLLRDAQTPAEQEHDVSPAAYRLDELHLNWIGYKLVGEGIGSTLNKCE